MPPSTLHAVKSILLADQAQIKVTDGGDSSESGVALVMVWPRIKKKKKVPFFPTSWITLGAD